MLADDFEPWSAKKTSILSRYTTSEKISITTVSTRACVVRRAAVVCMYICECACVYMHLAVECNTFPSVAVCSFHRAS